MVKSSHMADLIVIGGGLAGSEAAWQAAQRGLQVDLYEMRPHQPTGAHTRRQIWPNWSAQTPWDQT